MATQQPNREQQPRWLSLAEAKAYCPLGEKLLIRLVKEGKIKGGRQMDNGNRPWFFDSASIDRYMESMTIKVNQMAREKALEINQKLGITFVS